MVGQVGHPSRGKGEKRNTQGKGGKKKAGEMLEQNCSPTVGQEPQAGKKQIAAQARSRRQRQKRYNCEQILFCESLGRGVMGTTLVVLFLNRDRDETQSN